MTVNIGTKGYIEVKEHFLSFTGTTMGTAVAQQGNVKYESVQEGSFALTVDEPGGILAITTDTGDNDNVFLIIGPFKAADGGVWMEGRFKTDAVTTTAMLIGFQETITAGTPVMGVEFATETAAYNASIGGVAGLLHDPDATTNMWRAVGGDNSAAAWSADSTDSALATQQAPVNDEFDVVRVEINSHGDVDIFLARSVYNGALTLVKHADGVIEPTDITNAIMAFENRDATANVIEVDYFNAGGYIDWTQ